MFLRRKIEDGAAGLAPGLSMVTLTYVCGRWFLQLDLGGRFLRVDPPVVFYSEFSMPPAGNCSGQLPLLVESETLVG